MIGSLHLLVLSLPLHKLLLLLLRRLKVHIHVGSRSKSLESGGLLDFADAGAHLLVHLLHMLQVPNLLLLLAGAKVMLELGREKGRAEWLGGVVLLVLLRLQDGRPAVHALGRRRWVLAAALLVSLDWLVGVPQLVLLGAVAQIVEVLVRVFRRLMV